MAGENGSKRRVTLKFLVRPYTILVSVVAGIGFGCLFPARAALLEPYGKLYLALLQMCVLPLLMAAVISGLGRLLSSNHAGKYLVRMVLVFGAGVILAGTLGVLIAEIGDLGGGLSMKAQETLGKILSRSDITSGQVPKESVGLFTFVRMMVPTNPFEAVTHGRNLPVIFFCLLFGVALGKLRTHGSATTLVVIETIFETLLRMISWVMYGLPVGLFCLFSSQVALSGTEVFLALGKLVAGAYVGAMVLIVIYILAIAKMRRMSVWSVIRATKDPALVALGTSSSFASIPASILALQERLKIDENLSKLLIPIGVTLNPQGSALYFSIASIFMAQLFQANLGASGLLIVIFGSALAGMAISGVPAVAALSTLSIVLDPIGVPSAPAIVLLLAIDPFLDPIMTAVNVLSGCAATTVIAAKDRDVEI